MSSNRNHITVRPRRRVAGVAAAVLAITVTTGALVPISAGAGVGDSWTRTRVASYAMGDVGPVFNTLGQVSLGMVSCSYVTGFVCFGRTTGEFFTVKITDDSGRKVGGIIKIAGRDGWALSRTFCGVSGRLPAVPGSLYVSLDAPGDVRGAHWDGGPGCAEIQPLGTTTGATTQGATIGKVRVTFTAPSSPSRARSGGRVR